jgi:RNA polymerase sigma-54 factor
VTFSWLFTVSAQHIANGTVYRSDAEERVKVAVMELHIEQTQEPRQTIGISHRQIVAVRLLQMPSQELMGAIAYERDINPAIELMERESCNYCGAGVDSGAHTCPLCGMSLLGLESRHRDREDYALDRSIGAAAIGTPIEDDGSDPMVRVAGTVERGDGLLQMLNLMIAEDESEIAEYLVGNLDHHGFLVDSIIEDAANELSCRPQRIERVLRLLQRLDPPGIGARGAQECLLIQLQRLAQAGKPRKLAELLVKNHLAALAFRRFREVAHVVGRTPKVVEAEWRFIREQLHPYPTHGFDPDCEELVEVAASVRPDVVIHRRGTGFEAEVVEQQRYDLHVHTGYQWARQHMQELGGSRDEQQHIRTYVDRAQSFISALKQRWDTMQRVSDALIDLQRDFLAYGPRALKPLTRADVAKVVKLHESTVSRATDGKFVLLPTGQVIPFDNFFDSSLPVKQALRQWVATENPKRPLSDEQLARLLCQGGFEIARRTVAKYREEEGILPSRLRRSRS